PGPELRAESLAAPPGEEFQKKLFHAMSAAVRRTVAVMPSAGVIVQTQARHITAGSSTKLHEKPQNQRNPFIAHTAAFRQASITHKWCVARERLPLSGVGVHPGDGAENDQSESFECSLGACAGHCAAEHELCAR